MLNTWFWTLIILMTIMTVLMIAVPLLKKNSHKLKISIKLLLVIFPLMTIGMYLIFGHSGQLQQFWTRQSQEAAIKQQVASIKDSQQLIKQLRDHLKQQPASAEGWFLLGKLYLSSQQYENAENSLKKAWQLKPNNHDYLLAYAKANFFNQHNHLTPAVEVALKSVLESITQPVDALNLLAVNAYQNKDYRQAVKYWQQALALVPPDSPDSRTLLDMISQAQSNSR